MQFHTFHLAHWPEGWTQAQVYKYELDLIQYAEDLGFDGVWLAEHHFRRYGIIPSIMPFAGFVAARTTKVKIGTAIVVVPFHNPIRAAEEAAMIDLLSNGRLMYGFGRGYQAVEFQGFNMALSESRERTDEAIEIMKMAWTNDEFSYNGKYTKVENVNVLPKPVQKGGPPLWTASVSPETIGHYAKKGIPFISDPISTFGRNKRASEEWKQTAAANGHKVDKPNFGTLRGLIIGETEGEALALAEKSWKAQQDNNLINQQSAPVEKTGEFAAGYYYWKDRYLGANKQLDSNFFWERTWIAGDPERVIRIIRDLESWGFEHMLFTLGHYPTFTLEENKRRLKIFADNVMPEFRKKAVAAPAATKAR